MSWRLDSSRLHIEEPIGTLPEADRAGSCGWNGWGTLGALYANFGGSPLPTTSTVVCEVTVTVRANAQPGRARILGVEPVCANAAGAQLACEVQESWVDVQGAPSAMASSGWFEHDTLELEVMLYEGLAGPAPGQSESSAALLAALGNRGLLLRNQPSVVRRTMGQPMLPAEATHYAAHPHLAGAQLHRTLIVSLPTVAARDRALAELRSSTAVEWVASRRIPAMRMPPASDQETTSVSAAAAGGKSSSQVVPQDHLTMLGINHSPWATLPGGWGLVAVVDTGIEVEHAELKSFTGPGSVGGSHIPGGNYLPYFSVNVGIGNQVQDNLDEDQQNQVAKIGAPLGPCNPNGTGFAAPTAFGHGTHVAGLIGANALDNAGVSGVCRHCGLAIIKSSAAACTTVAPHELTVGLYFDAGMVPATGNGAQVINLSGGRQADVCSGHHTSDSDLCKKVRKAYEERDIFVVASSGNHRAPIQGPANSKYALAAGEIDQSGALWDDSPGNNEGCTFFPDDPENDDECGSNYTQGVPGAYTAGKQELVALAFNVVSTVYHEKDWNARIRCGDSFGGGLSTDGIGLCTGTSISAPIIAGVVGLLRSIHPLLPVGELDPLNPSAATGLRKLLALTASGKEWHPQSGWAPLDGADWSPHLGWGPPDVAAAAQGLLGFKNGEPVMNRAIPLFSLLQSGGDHAAVATPQLAIALRDLGYANDGDEIPGYAALPRHPYYGAPRARAFVLSTEFTPQSSTVNPVPLYLMVKKINPKQGILDHILVSSLAQVQLAADAGYAYAGRQGYLYPYCGGQPGCTAPLGTEPLHLKCRPSGGRCAVFPDLDLGHFGTLGFTEPFPGITDPLGYAYSRGDADSDGLPDAAEYVLGTDPNLDDTDGDLVLDGDEYPFAGLPISDPCDGDDRHRCTQKVSVFRHGFEAIPAP